MTNQSQSNPVTATVPGQMISTDSLTNMIPLFRELAMLMKEGFDVSDANHRALAQQFNFALNRLERRSTLQKYYAAPWFQTFMEAQEIIVDNDPFPYYFTYREYELTYWTPIPKWLYRDLPKFEHTPKVLDIGIGYGTLAVYSSLIRDCELYGLDFNMNFNENIRKNFNVTYQQANLEKEEIRFDTQFDVIIFTEILEHFNFNPLPTLHKIKKLLKPGGTLYLSTPDAEEWGRLPYYNSWRDMPPVNPNFEKTSDDHIYQYYKDELIELLTEVGFQIVNFDISPGSDGRHFAFKLTH